MNKRGAVLGCLLALAISSLSAQAWKGTIAKQGDVVVVKNPKTPIYKDPILTLKEELTIGGGETKEPAMLGEVFSLVVDSSERIYILDGTSLQVKVFDKSGRYLRSMGRRGEGPGEFMDAYRMMIDRKNDRLFVKDNKFGFVVFDSQGKHVRNLPADEARRSQNSAIDSRGSIILNSIKIQDTEHRWDVLKRFDAEMILGDEIRSVDIGSPYDVAAPLVGWVLAPNDDIVFGYPDSYRVEWMDRSGRIKRIIEKEHTPVALDAEDKARIAKAIASIPLPPESGQKGSFPMPPELAKKLGASKYRSAYRKIQIDGKSRLFVQTWQKRDDSFVTDIFDAEGRYMAETVFPVRSEFYGNKLYAIEEDADGYPMVKRYALEWNI